MQATRQQILDHLRLRTEATVSELGEFLSLTATGVRQHLTVLEQEGLVSSREERGKVGRPALVYSLTARGEASYPMRYDVVANEVHSTYGPAPYQQMIKGVAVRMAAPHGSRLAGAPLENRVDAACELVRDQGVVADWERKDGGFLLHERTCPYPEMARHNSAACVIDVAYMRELTGMDARLVECRVRGDRGCTYRLQPVDA